MAAVGHPCLFINLGMQDGESQACPSTTPERMMGTASAFAHPAQAIVLCVDRRSSATLARSHVKPSMLTGLNLLDLLDDVFRHADGGGIDQTAIEGYGALAFLCGFFHLHQNAAGAIHL